MCLQGRTGVRPKPGDELKVETTICHEIRQSREPVIIDEVSKDAIYCGHHTPAQYGFQSYISMPIILPDGSFFGTLCAIDPKPRSCVPRKSSGCSNCLRSCWRFTWTRLTEIQFERKPIGAGEKDGRSARAIHCRAGP